MQHQHRQQQRLKTLVLALAAAFPVVVTANPLDPTVAAGHATFATSGSTLSVTNAPGTVIDWRSFSIGNGEVTRFIQQNAASQVLNRVTGADPSSILGTLQSNGQVFLINPNGIVFGANARVDVAGLVASTLGISNDNFLAGRLTFGAQGGAGNIRNDGQLQALGGGSIFLIAPSVENHGIVRAPDGAVVLAAGKQATLVDTYRPDVRVEISAPGDAAINVGHLIGGNVGIYAGAIRNEGTVSATGASVGSDGTVILRATNSLTTSGTSLVDARRRIDIDAGVVSHAGEFRAGGAVGGEITLRAGSLLQSGSIRADGAVGDGGRISIVSTGNILQTASAYTSARGQSGGFAVMQGGAGRRVFSSGTIDVSGVTRAGGELQVLGDDIVLAGATLLATGPTAGGTILVGGDTQGANPAVPNAHAVYAGLNTRLDASATAAGRGGRIVFWSDGTTAVGAALAARGGSMSGDGGSIEVSGKGGTAFGGSADASATNGASGTFLLDPKNIIVDDFNGGLTFRNLLDPNPNTDSIRGNGYGQVIQPYDRNTLVTDPFDNAGGTRAGAIYLYRGSDGAILTQLSGAAAEDSIGTGTRISIGANLLLVHTLYGSGNGDVSNAAGAVTWLNLVTGKLSDGTSGGSITANNSLLGSFAGDRVNRTLDGTVVTPVAASGNGYFLISEAWNSKRGAITWMDASTGKLADGTTGGHIGTSNSLVGENPEDRVGYMRGVGYPYYTYRPVLERVGNGYVFFSPYFGSGGDGVQNGKGAVTWIDPATGRLANGATGGVVSASNSIVGANSGDQVGAQSNGESFLQTWGNNALILSPAFDGNKGAATWINGNTGRLSDDVSTGGVVSAANSYVGTTVGDSNNVSWRFTDNGLLYLLPEWNNGRGALTWIDMSTGKTPSGAIAGEIGAAISIVGGHDGDHIASDVRQIRSGHFVIVAPDWFRDDDAGTAANAGAVAWVSNTGTLGDGSTHGLLSQGNALTGEQANDRVGSQGILESSYLNATSTYLVISREWGGGDDPSTAKGAVTWMNGNTGELLDGSTGGFVSRFNSLVGRNAGDLIGTNAIDPSRNGDGVYAVSSDRNFVIASPRWSSGRGAVTFVNGESGTLANGASAVGFVSAGNSLVGTTADDSIATGPGDQVGSFIDVLSNGHVLVRSPNWSDFDINSWVGAVTWMSGTNGLLASMTSSTQFSSATSRVGSDNSLQGVRNNDAVGSGGIVDAGSYVLIRSPDASNTGRVAYNGAVTWMDANRGTLANMTSGADYNQIGGVLSSQNSVLDVGDPTISRTGSNHQFLLNQEWSGGRGALTWIGSNGRLSDGNTGGLVTVTNSLVGSSSSEGALMSVRTLSNDHYLLLTPGWSNGGQTADAGAVTWIDANSGRLVNGAAGGVIGANNSVVGASPGDQVGSGGISDVGYTYYSNAFLIRSPNFRNDGIDRAGAVTWLNASNGLLAGMTNADAFDGTVSISNSLVGRAANDALGGTGMSVTTIDYYGPEFRMIITHSGASNGEGAVTWMRGRNGILSDGTSGGVISSLNSVLGSASGDAIGSGGIQQISSADGINRVFILSPGWSDGGDKLNAGAITWMNGADGRLADGRTGGVVSAGNSIVGGATGDRIGRAGVQAVGANFYDQRYLVLSPDWNAAGTRPGAGAVTWIEGLTGKLVDGSVGGVVSETNSLVGGAAGDAIGSGGLRNLGNGKFLLLSPNWSAGGTRLNAGAVTWFDGVNGNLIAGRLAGVVSNANSLVGKAAGDQVGIGAIQSFGIGTLVFTPNWSNGGTKAQAGAITWMNTSTGLLSGMTSAAGFDGVVDTVNSLVGANAGDLAGGYQTFGWAIRPFVLDGNHVLLTSQNFASRAGAVTWMDTSTGRLSDGSTGGQIGVTNSLIGARADDQIGNNGNGIAMSFDASSNRNAMILSPNWNGGMGAVTWMNGATGKLVDGSTGGVVGRGNSLVGSAAGDRIGQSYATTFVTGTGTAYAFYNGAWGGNRGAVTWMSGATGLLANMTSSANYDGTINAANSLVGDAAGDGVGLFGVQTVTNSANKALFVVRSPDWNGARGAVTAIAGSDGRLIGGATGGSITAANSLIGGSAGDRIGQYGPQRVGAGNWLLVSTTFGSNRGAVTLMDRDWSITGVVSADNSVIGGTANAGLLFQSEEGTIVQDSANNTSLLRFSTEGAGRIVALSNAFATGATPPQNFADNAGGDVTIRPQTIASMLNTGTAVVLQANNDIIIRKAILATGTTRTNGLLTLQAGRSIAVNANVTNTNRNAAGVSIAMVANEIVDNALVASDQRDSGPASITLGNGASVTGGGAVVLTVKGTDLAGSALVASATSLISTLSGALTLNAPTLGSPLAPLRLAAAGGVTARSTAGGAFLQQPTGSAAAGTFKVTVPDDQPLLLSVPNGTLTLSRDLSRAGSIAIQASDVQVVDTTIASRGTVTITSNSLSVTSQNEATSIGGDRGTVLNIGSGGVTIRGGSAIDGSGAAARLGATGGVCSGAIAGDLTLIGGSASSASATLFGSPDIGSRSTDNSGALQVGGVITMTSGSGEGSFARIEAASPRTIFVNFPTRTSGGYTVDGQAVTALGDSGFFAGGTEAVLGQNLFITYGGSPLNPSMNPILADIENATRNRWLAKVEDNSQPILPQCR